MKTVETVHDKVVVTRSYPVSAARVFGAWADAAALARWYLPGDENWTSRVDAHEFRIGGRKMLSFGPKGGPRYTEDCRYEDIVEPQRICFAMTILRGAERITTSMVTVEIKGEDALTNVKVTDQVAILDGGDTAKDRERGWGETLDKLTGELTRQ